MIVEGVKPSIDRTDEPWKGLEIGADELVEAAVLENEWNDGMRVD